MISTFLGLSQVGQLFDDLGLVGWGVSWAISLLSCGSRASFLLAIWLSFENPVNLYLGSLVVRWGGL